MTLATIDAAAMDKQRASPLIRHSDGMGRFDGVLFPSISAKSAGVFSCSSASRMASKDACNILRRSISSTLTCEIPTSALLIIGSNNAFRFFAERVLESANPSGIFEGSRTTAQAVTGPAQGPRPT